jgi:hypothetical protein
MKRILFLMLSVVLLAACSGKQDDASQTETPTARSTIEMVDQQEPIVRPTEEYEANADKDTAPIADRNVVDLGTAAVIADKYGVDASAIDVSVTSEANGKMRGSYTLTNDEGTKSEPFLAAFVIGKWRLVHDGGEFNCRTVADYNFPADMVPECFRNNGEPLIPEQVEEPVTADEPEEEPEVVTSDEEEMPEDELRQIEPADETEDEDELPNPLDETSENEEQAENDDMTIDEMLSEISQEEATEDAPDETEPTEEDVTEEEANTEIETEAEITQ